MKKTLILLVVAVTLSRCQPQKFDFIIRNAVVYDGSGTESFKGDVGINADTIAFIGDLSRATSTTEWDAKGLALSPGFIDTHSHHSRGMFEIRDMPSCVSQGITTIVVGQDGGSYFPLSDFFNKIEEIPVAVNVASYSGHNTLRDSVIIGDYKRFCTTEEVELMKTMLKQDMDAGALGLSTGLEYDPGIFSDPAEVMELAKLTSDVGGRYISHIRSEDRFFWTALDEILKIGSVTKMPVQISHTKLAMKSIWGQSDKLIRKLDSARAAGVQLTADIYPYAYWQSTMTVLFTDRDFKNRKTAEFALTEITTPEGVLLGNYSPDTSYIGKTLAEISTLRKTDAPKTLMDLIAEIEATNGDESIIATSMMEQDIAAIMKWPYTNICSDGSGVGRHPRGFGAFTKVLRQYVREEKVLSLKEAIRKMTSLSADNLGIKKRGRLAVGQFADLVLFDPEKVADLATPKKPQLQSVGIEKVWVNGKEVYSQGKTGSVYPGKVIRR
jgi:N-acyl-D-amino-acid deacylase